MGFAYSGKQLSIFALADENAERIQRQNEREISVIIGNPPYNANQLRSYLLSWEGKNGQMKYDTLSNFF
jgi:predicted helicase